MKDAHTVSWAVCEVRSCALKVPWSSNHKSFPNIYIIYAYCTPVMIY